MAENGAKFNEVDEEIELFEFLKVVEKVESPLHEIAFDLAPVARLLIQLRGDWQIAQVKIGTHIPQGMRVRPHGLQRGERRPVIHKADVGIGK